MIAVSVEGISLVAPGLPNWTDSQAVFRGVQSYQAQALPTLDASLLPANERRRAGRTVKLALHVASAALANANLDLVPASVFACSGGDSDIVNKICTALTQPMRSLSPTQFHNSVHNAPAGYWSIATQCREPSISLSAHDGSFAAGLLEASMLVCSENKSVLLVAYDVPPPQALDQVLAITEPFATALLLAPINDTDSPMLLRLTLVDDGETTMDDTDLELLRQSNPAARSLPLLLALAGSSRETVLLPYSDNKRIQVCLDYGHAQ